MQQHPVPQNVVSFQFKLIGDMTVRQFVYLAGGTLVAYMVSKTITNDFIKWPLVFGTFGAGFAFAFMPIEDRPLDRWVANFFKAVYAPTMFLWRKTSDLPEVLQPAISAIPRSNSTILRGGVDKQTMEEYVQSLPEKTLSGEDAKEELIIKGIIKNLKTEYGGKIKGEEIISGESTVMASVAQVAPTPSQVAPVDLSSLTPSPVNSINTNVLRPKDQEKPLAEEIATSSFPKEKKAKMEVSEIKIPHEEETITTKDTKGLEKKIASLQNDIQNLNEAKDKNADKESQKLADYLKTLQGQLTSALSEKQTLQEELTKAKKQAETKKQEEVLVATETMQVEKKASTTVKFVPSQMSAQVGVSQPTIQNIISGIIKDQTGDFIPNILIEIKDKDDKTERALKTNRLGQFSIATPLDNGVHTIHFEDPRNLHQFDIIEVTLTGNIFPAMEVRAKSQKDTEREKLREALFGKQTN
ncbi:PrgI family protein [Candidatus Gottesmanbacteria bacterium]|nr:PrgI family protein [Candidatus Gottesmanbacteria bacterium]